MRLAEVFQSRLSECLERSESGELKRTITFPDESVLNKLAKSLARMVSAQEDH